jgi:hypothetical protein
MKRSTQVAAPLLAAAALAMTVGCRRPEMQRCVDENNTIVDDNLCKNQPNQPQQRSDGHGGFIPIILPYRYYYGGWGGFGLGGRADGGSFAPTAGRSYTTRGGFGSSFAEGSGRSGSSSHGEGSGHGGGAGE